MMAAITAAREGAVVTLWEKNDRLGRKLSITGKGRCNVTNACSVEELIQHLTGNGRFLYSAFHLFDNRDTMDFFEEIGVPLKVERGQRVFPVSDHASTVVRALEKELRRLGVEIRLNCAAEGLLLRDGCVVGARTEAENALFDAVILATGGCTYRATGSSGDGYALAGEVGHSVTSLLPSLVPLVSPEPWIGELAGLSLRNVRVSLWPVCGKKLAEEFGEMLFTHFGLSGPCILTLSDTASRYWSKRPKEELVVRIDLKPALTPEQLDLRVQRDFQKYSRKIFANALGDLLPKSLIPVMICRSEIAPQTPVHQITREERRRLTGLFKDFSVRVSGTRPLDEGIVTAGGIRIKEVNPKTFASKLANGLYIVGELLDVHGYTGGYNLQAAFSSGYAAGKAAAEA